VAVLALSLPCTRAHAQPSRAIAISQHEAVELARRGSPDVAVARGRESVARAEVGIAGTYPNPTVTGGTSTQAAKWSADIAIPLLVLGQRGAAMDAGRADLATVRADTEVTWNEVRASTSHAFVALWLAAQSASTRSEALVLSARLDDAVHQRVDVGAAPPLEGLRAHAERLRAEADAHAATTLIDAAASELGRWLGVTDGPALRPKGDPAVPEPPPSLASLRAHAERGPTVRREEADARAAEARADRERALVRPMLTLGLGLDAGDASYANTNYRAQLGVEVPLLSQRGAYVERERNAATAARTRATAERTRAATDLIAAYTRFEAASTRVQALEASVVPAMETAAKATEEAYGLGRSPLVAVLDAERARLDARLALIEARAERANTWIDVERATGGGP